MAMVLKYRGGQRAGRDLERESVGTIVNRVGVGINFRLIVNTERSSILEPTSNSRTG